MIHLTTASILTILILASIEDIRTHHVHDIFWWIAISIAMAALIIEDPKAIRSRIIFSCPYIFFFRKQL